MFPNLQNLQVCIKVPHIPPRNGAFTAGHHKTLEQASDHASRTPTLQRGIRNLSSHTTAIKRKHQRNQRGQYANAGNTGLIVVSTNRGRSYTRPKTIIQLTESLPSRAL